MTIKNAFLDFFNPKNTCYPLTCVLFRFFPNKNEEIKPYKAKIWGAIYSIRSPKYLNLNRLGLEVPKFDYHA